MLLEKHYTNEKNNLISDGSSQRRIIERVHENGGIMKKVVFVLLLTVFCVSLFAVNDAGTYEIFKDGYKLGESSFELEKLGKNLQLTSTTVLTFKDKNVEYIEKGLFDSNYKGLEYRLDVSDASSKSNYTAVFSDNKVVFSGNSDGQIINKSENITDGYIFDKFLPSNLWMIVKAFNFNANKTNRVNIVNTSNQGINTLELNNIGDEKVNGKRYMMVEGQTDVGKVKISVDKESGVPVNINFVDEKIEARMLFRPEWAQNNKVQSAPRSETVSAKSQEKNIPAELPESKTDKNEKNIDKAKPTEEKKAVSEIKEVEPAAQVEKAEKTAEVSSKASSKLDQMMLNKKKEIKEEPVVLEKQEETVMKVHQSAAAVKMGSSSYSPLSVEQVNDTQLIRTIGKHEKFEAQLTLDITGAEEIIYLNRFTQEFMGTMDNGIASGIVESKKKSHRVTASPEWPLQYPLIVDERYLLPEKGIDSDDANIKERAEQIIAPVKYMWDAARAIGLWVNRNIEYSNDSYGAKEAFENQRGDSRAKALVTVALCRSVGIPARVVNGAIFVDKMVDHFWVEVFLSENVGWGPIDPTLKEFDKISASHISFYVGAQNYPFFVKDVTFKDITIKE